MRNSLLAVYSITTIIYFSNAVDDKICNSSEQALCANNSLVQKFATTEPTPVTPCMFHCDPLMQGGSSWPPGCAEQTIYAYGYCFKNDTSWMAQRCTDSDPEGSCEVQYKSSVSGYLISSSGMNQTTPELYDFLRDHTTDLNSLDVYVLHEAYSDPVSLEFMADNSLGNVISDILLNLDKSVLKRAQLKMLATDLWLNLIGQMGTWGEEFEGDNFALLSLGNYNALAVQDDGSFLHFDITENSEILENQLPGNLESVFWLHPFYQITALTYHKKDHLFIQSDSFATLTAIFGINNGEYVALPVTIAHKFGDITDGLEIRCVYWKINIDEHIYGSWDSDGILTIVPPFYICKYVSMSVNFAMMVIPVDDITTTLMDILASDAPVSEIYGRLLQASFRYRLFNSIDVYLVGQILEKLSESNDTNLDALSIVINNLHKIGQKVLTESQIQTGATDTILYYIDVILGNYSEEYRSRDQFRPVDTFTALVVNKTAFTGLLLFKNGRYQDLREDIDLSNLTQYDDLETAFILKPELRNQIDDDTYIVVTIFLNDLLFNPPTRPSSVSKIFGILLPNVGNFTEPISVFHQIDTRPHVSECAHWSYNPPENIEGFWKNDSKSGNYSHLVQCDFWHTTHFALLLLDQDKYKGDKALDYITIVSFSFSLAGLLTIVLAAAVYRKFREKAGNKILLHFVAACILQIVAFYVASVVKNRTMCILSGALLHYSTISEFCWMLVAAYLQFRRFVTVLQTPPSHVLLKGCLFAWGLPTLPVITTLVVDMDNYWSAKTDLCYPTGYYLYFAVWLPVGIIVLINSAIFLYVIKTVFGNKGDTAASNKTDVLYKWRLVFFLFCMLGLTWIFGFLAELDGGVVFAYLFCILATLQGFLMFLFFVALNKDNRNMFVRSFKRKFNVSQSGTDTSQT